MSIPRSIIHFSTSSASQHPCLLPCRMLVEDCMMWEGNFKTHWQVKVFKQPYQLAAPHRLTSNSWVLAARRCPSCWDKCLRQTKVTSLQYISKTTEGGTIVATDGCRGKRQHQASTYDASPKCSPSLWLFIWADFLSQALLPSFINLQWNTPVTHPVSFLKQLTFCSLPQQVPKLYYQVSEWF